MLGGPRCQMVAAQLVGGAIEWLLGLGNTSKDLQDPPISLPPAWEHEKLPTA
jgi:hypothetical protein